MSNLSLRSITGKDGGPVFFPTGISIGAGAAGGINDIGIPGQRGFGVGICPGPLPAGMVEMTGTHDQSHDNYGNYIFSDGSVMIWIPAFYYKWGTGTNGLAVNVVDIKPFSAYVEVATANAAGYALHRAFYDGGAVQPGFFRDKYKCSNNGGIASSLKNGNPLSTANTNNPIGNLTGAPANAYYGVIAAAKTRGVNFFPASIFQRNAIALISKAHGQAAISTTWCAWYDAAGVTNFPKGCNNNALGDLNDTALSFASAGNATYPTANKTGSANLFARTTHNGQNCGSADDNGTIYEICLGLTSDGTNYYILNPAVAMKNITAGNTLATDAWGAAAYAAQYTNLGATFGALWASGANRMVAYGSAMQVFDAATNGNAWATACAGIPLATGIGGTNAFGNDVLYDYKVNELCAICSSIWTGGVSAGMWALGLFAARSTTDFTAGFRTGLYL